MKVQEIHNQVDLRSVALPAFQRRYVWNRNQVNIPRCRGGIEMAEEGITAAVWLANQRSNSS